MNCPAFEEPIARYAGSDLPPDEALAVERHLAACAACAESARALAEDRTWLGSRPPETGEIDYAALRRKIRQGIAVEQRRSWRWLPAWLAAAAILLAVTVGIMRPRGERGLARAPVAQMAAPVARVAQQTAAVVSKRKSRTRGSGADQGVRPTETALEAAMRMFQELEPEPVPPPDGSDSPVEMRLSTRDPNVTIILLQESKGDSQ